MSGKTPINRLEGWPLSFHLCREEEERNSAAETGWNEQFLLSCNHRFYTFTVTLAQHAEGEQSHEWADRGVKQSKPGELCLVPVALRCCINTPTTWRPHKGRGQLGENKKAISCFCGRNNGAGWVNKGASHYPRSNSPSLNKHWVSACFMSIICLFLKSVQRLHPLNSPSSSDFN